MNRKIAIITVVIIAVLLAAIFVSLKLSETSMELQKEILSNAEILLKDKDNEIILTKEDISNCGEENFHAVLDTSDTEPSTHSYTGVELKSILIYCNIDLHDKSTVVLSAADGYSVAYSIDEVVLDNNVYIAYMEDGKLLGSRDADGRGPYEAIIVYDNFSNRRCKWLTKIEVR
jgi:hypothetical protein